MTEQHYTCSKCSQPWSRPAARGRIPKYCPTCRATAHGRRMTRCQWCDKDSYIRADSSHCSRQCAANARTTPTCQVRSPKQPPEPKPALVKHLAECIRCGLQFETWQSKARTCSRPCRRKEAKLRRRVKEAETYGEWTWADFMRIARKFNYCCAYCDTKPARLDPDHVVPLSRGGSNTTSNLLPACATCNSDKQAHSLTEWAEHRTTRNLPPLRTTWEQTDSRYWHLTEPALRNAA